MPRARSVVLAATAALLVKRAVRRRVQAAPLWPLPALEEPISGRGRRAPTVVRRVVVTARTSPAEGVVLLRLEGTRLPPWEPGAHLDLVLPSGLVRTYSLCGDPAEAGVYTVAARLVADGRGGSREVHERLRTGTEIEIRGPRNRFPLVDAPAYVFVAGGIGITPLLPMLRAVRAAGARWRLLYCGRSRATMPFLDELEGAGDVTVAPEDEAGLPDLALLDGLPPETAVYVCGPDGLMDAVAQRLPQGRPLHLERFTPATPAPGDAFEAELRRSGRTVTVAAGQSLLAAVRAELPHVPYSCEQGFCGTCRQPVLAGEVDHRDELLTEEERRDSMLLCVSRCRGGRLVLDL
ncbi:PDR/VanB family oxidoreductase [Streptomyces ficellus]|uniref:Oxidoreductase n=1 Tax=Streptomyces ficellus TaxID=1977088 RepID=A0A6I6FB44_9ACTN|nr:PDR/VanB family oxidoreductase [Streptomyces ficellus]QGV80960.1 oxidoreductase [Streptomyces ficellus]